MPLHLDMAIVANAPDAEAICKAALADYQIPDDLHGGLVRYLVDGIRPGSFLTAVLENDLQEAVMRANPMVNLLALPQLLRFLFNEAPSVSYGSPERVSIWSATRRKDHGA